MVPAAQYPVGHAAVPLYPRVPGRKSPCPFTAERFACLLNTILVVAPLPFCPIGVIVSSSVPHPHPTPTFPAPVQQHASSQAWLPAPWVPPLLSFWFLATPFPLVLGVYCFPQVLPINLCVPPVALWPSYTCFTNALY